MKESDFVVDIELADRSDSIKAFASVTIDIPDGSLIANSFKVLQKDGKPPYVLFPSIKGKNQDKYFPIVDAKGEVRKRIVDLVLEAYRKKKAK